MALEKIHGDLCGLITPITPRGNIYIFVLIDDYTRIMWTYLLKDKSEALSAFKSFYALFENSQDRKIMTLRMDNGGEFTSKKFSRYCEESGIVRHYSASYSPQQNGVVERRNRTLVEMSRSLLKERNVPNYIWGEAVRHSTYLINRLPTRVVTGIVPYEAWKKTIYGTFASVRGEPEGDTPSTTESLTSPGSEDEAQNFRSISKNYAETEPTELEDEELFLMGVDELANYTQAEKQSEWKKAIQVEMEAVEKNDTWELTELPQGDMGFALVYSRNSNNEVKIGYSDNDLAGPLEDRESIRGGGFQFASLNVGHLKKIELADVLRIKKNGCALCYRLRTLESSCTLHLRACDHLPSYLVGYPNLGDRDVSEIWGEPWLDLRRKSREIVLVKCYPDTGRCTIPEVLRL
ncbi:uncharacterized protein LOC141666249 [Apium graveolens]|uniref:uncharacterized protein LOC141666249 n=1 Tax=Apium graveolens TaxID=4045 RepID=UPI003D79AF7F